MKIPCISFLGVSLCLVSCHGGKTEPDAEDALADDLVFEDGDDSADAPDFTDYNFCCWDCYAGDNPYAREYSYSDGPGSTTTDWYTLDEDGHLHCDGHSLNALDGVEAAFADESGHDYHLTAGSDLRAAGTDLSVMPWFVDAMALDRDGRARTSWDIGPYEHVP